MFFILSLLSWLGSFSLSLPAVNNIQLTPSAWQSPPLLTYGPGCLSPVVSRANVPTRAPFWQEMCYFQLKAQVLLPKTSWEAAGVQSENTGVLALSTLELIFVLNK